jgi:hypothetical protein
MTGTMRTRAALDGDLQLHPTKNDLPATARTEVVRLLNARLADAIDLQTQCKQAHWNVRGHSSSPYTSSSTRSTTPSRTTST